MLCYLYHNAGINYEIDSKVLGQNTVRSYGNDEAYNIASPTNSPFYQESNRSFGAVLGKLIYPASRSYSNSTPEYNLMCATYNPGSPKDVVDYKNLYHILVFGGALMQASENFDSKIAVIAKSTNTHIHVMEMPGVNAEASGRMDNHSHCVKVAILQVQHLLDQGADPEKITLYGLSLGGAISTITAAHFHSQGKKVSVFNDRSFSTLSAVVNGHIKETTFKYAVMPLIGVGAAACKWVFAMQSPLLMSTALTLSSFVAANFIVKIALRVTNWEMNAGDAYLSIPRGFKGLSLIIDDHVINNVGGLFNVLGDSDWLSGGAHSYIGADQYRNHHCESFFVMYRFAPNSQGLEVRVNLNEDFTIFAKRVQIRNEIKDFLTAFYASLETAILSGESNDIKLPDSMPDVMKSMDKSALAIAMKKAVTDSRALIAEYKAEQNKYRLTKGLRSIYQSLRGFVRNVISLIYNLHEGIELDKHLRDADALSDKIIEVSVEAIVTELLNKNTEEGRQSIMDYQYKPDGPDRAANLKSFTDKLNNEVLEGRQKG